MITRTFTPDQLEEIGVPNELPADVEVPGLATELHREHIDSRRWASVHRLIFRAPDDGKAYRVTYQQPLTEHQECDIWFDDSEVKAVEVEQREVTVTKWLPIEQATS